MAFTQADFPSFDHLIAEYCEPNDRERNKHTCPVCGGSNLSVASSGKWNCFSDESAKHRQEICKWLNGVYWEDEKRFRSPRNPVQRDRRWNQRQYQSMIRARQLEARMDELDYLLWNSVDESFDLTPELYWKEFIEFLIEGGFDILKGVESAEKFTLLNCPPILKECWNG